MENLINFDIAKKAKEKGFNDITRSVYNDFGSLFDFNSVFLRNSTRYYAPTRDVLCDWLLEEHNIDIVILPVFANGKCSYDSFKRLGWRYVVTKGDCIYSDIYTFNQHLESELIESNRSDDDKETWDEFLNRINVYISNDKKELIDLALIEALDLIKN